METSGRSQTAKQKPRYEWMDMARGFAILLVSIFHAGSYLLDHGGSIPKVMVMLNDAMAPFRMPLLIFLSGILLDRSLDKGVVRFAYGKFRNLVWPYLIWIVVFAVSAGNLGLLGKVDTWAGSTYLWYLAFLMVYFAIAVPLARVPHLIIAAYALAFSLLSPDGSKYGERLFLLMGFFFLGAFAGQHLADFERILRSRWALACLPVAIGLSIVSAAMGPIRYSPEHAAIICVAVLGVCSAFMHLPKEKLAAPLLYVGRNSLVFYVTNIPTVYILSRSMLGAGISDPIAIMIACFTGSLLVGIALTEISNRFAAVKLLFAAPDVLRIAPDTFAGKLDALIERTGITGRLPLSKAE